MTVRERPYQRRRRGPVIAVVSVLAVIAVITWTTVLVTAGSGAGTTTCPASTAGPAPGEPQPSDALDAATPVPASEVRINVLNAGGQRGQANLVAAQFGDLGFTQGAAPENDPLFPDGNMTCVGQIRFGPAGEGAAGTVALVLPCAELVRDARTGPDVDVSVGTAFGDLNPSRAGRSVLDQLAAPSSGDTGSGNADPAAGESATPAVGAVDPATLEEARSVTC